MAQLTKEIGDSGLERTWGIISDDFLSAWKTTSKKVETINEMLRNSPVIGALRLAIEMPIRDIDWQVVSDAGEDDERVTFVEEAMAAMSHSWNDHIIDALLYPFYGWSMFTITYQRIDGRLLWRKFKMLGHDTVQQWLFDPEGNVSGVQQWSYLWPEPIPIDRMLLYRFRKTRGNPEGESILRPAYVPYYYAKHMGEIEAIGIERDLTGLPVVRLPQGADTTDGSEDMTTAKKMVRNVRQDEQAGVILPHEWEFELINSPGPKQTMADQVIQRYEKRILMATLSQFIILGMDQIGSLSLSKDQTDFFTMAVNAVADIIAETFTKFAIPRLLKLNGYDEDGVKLEHSPAGDIDLEMLGTVLAQTAPFISWTEDDEVWLRSVMRLPEKSVEEIQAAREEKRQQALEIRQAAGPPQFGRDDNTATHFAAGNAPDDDERRDYERRMQEHVHSVLQKQKKRVLRDARKLRR